MMKTAWKILRETRRPLLYLNIVYFGLVFAGMLVAWFNRSMQAEMLAAAGAGWEEGFLAAVGSAYIQGGILKAAVLTFLINLAVGCFLSITLPSLIIPFSGLLVGGLRALVWGIMFSPASLDVSAASLASGTLLALLLFLEGQGYILAMLAAFDQGRALIRPATIQETRRGKAYLKGLTRSLKLYLLVTGMLLGAAVYEALIGIVLLPILGTT